MLLIDDILLAPVRGVLWVVREIYNAAQEELANEDASIRLQLSDLYMMLETGRISQEEFDSQETVFLDRLDKLENRAESEESDENGGSLEE